MTPFPKLIKPLIFITVPLLVLAIALRYILPVKFYSPALPFLVIFVFSSQLILLKILFGSVDSKFNRFVNRFMAASFIKLLIYLVVILVYSSLYRSDALPFAVSFVILYMVYTVFEISILLKAFKTPS
jgi:hypothetical protein